MPSGRFDDRTISEEGEFGVPVRLNAVRYESMLEARPDSAAETDDFLYDDEPGWNQPLAMERKRPAQPAHSRMQSSTQSSFFMV